MATDEIKYLSYAEAVLLHIIEVKASLIDLLELVVAVEAGRWEVDEIESWLRQHVAAFP